jgi:preprotein translocase subunit YajC
MIILQSGSTGGVPQLIFFASIFLIMYFFFLRPQVKKQKAQDNFAKDLTKGDEVVTGSGIIGRINKIEGNIIHLQIDQKTFIRVLKGAISKEMTENFNKKPEEK